MQGIDPSSRRHCIIASFGAAAALTSQATAPNVWAEHAPPRLDQDAVNKLIAKFRTNYPSEHLDSDTRPSIRLLSLVHQWFKPHGTILWIPWRPRMSEKTYQELIEARRARTLRAEAQLISSALFDETPEISIASGAVNTAWLTRTQIVFSNAIAICGGAHLRILRAFDKRVLDLATQSMAPDSGLRAVHTQELLQADRIIWSKRGKNMGKKEGMERERRDPFHYQGIYRPCNDHCDLATKLGNKTLRLRYSRMQCTNKQCKYAHQSATKLPNGQVCGQRHPACTHKFKQQPAEASATAPPGT